jgi:hypothetical protein
MEMSEMCMVERQRQANELGREGLMPQLKTAGRRKLTFGYLRIFTVAQTVLRDL